MPFVIVDTGCANLFSVEMAMRRLGVEPVISRKTAVLENAERIILPGVGSAKAAMNTLQEARLIDTLRAFKKPLLGICLGMQLLFSKSEEGNTECLDLLPGHVKALEKGPERIPNMGWSKLNIQRKTPLLKGIMPNEWVYFVHSFALPVSETTLASSAHNKPFSAVVGKGNIFGVQFHPERSQETGAKILKNFLEIPC